MIRAKFQVESVLQQKGTQVVTARPVMGGSDENKSFSKWTPSGKLEMQITDETPAFDMLKPGQEFYMDLTPIPMP